MKKIGLYFGSFNPIHNGHMTIANYALKKLNLDMVLFIVSPQNPFKENADLISFEDRFQMAKISCQKYDKLNVCDIEKHLPIPSYTYNTLQALEKQFHNTQFTIIMGADNFMSVDKWKHSEFILSKSILVIPRSLSNEEDNNLYKLLIDKQKEIQQYNGNNQIYIADDIDLMDISSTSIRYKILNKIDVSDSIDKNVLQYIYDKKLYMYGRL